MTAGRPRKPLHLHVVEGTLRPDRHGKRLKGEPRPVGDPGRAAGLPVSEAQREIWTQQLRHSPPGLLKAIDWSTVAALGGRLRRPQAGGRDAQRTRPLGPGWADGQKARVLIKIVNQQAGIMLRMSSELGFSPVSRARVSVDPRVAPNPLTNSRSSPSWAHQRPSRAVIDAGHALEETDNNVATEALLGGDLSAQGFSRPCLTSGKFAGRPHRLLTPSWPRTAGPLATVPATAVAELPRCISLGLANPNAGKPLGMDGGSFRWWYLGDAPSRSRSRSPGYRPKWAVLPLPGA